MEGDFVYFTIDWNSITFAIVACGPSVTVAHNKRGDS